PRLARIAFTSLSYSPARRYPAPTCAAAAGRPRSVAKGRTGAITPRRFPPASPGTDAPALRLPPPPPTDGPGAGADALSMTTPRTPPAPDRGLSRTAQVIIVSSVMFSFISYWRTAAVVLCDLASTAYYIGGIVESSIGKAAPFFILGVMLFSYAVRNVY